MTDSVNHPAHYNAGRIECINMIDVIVHGYEGEQAYYIGNVIKYITRAPHKHGTVDLKKAKWYLDRLIAKVEGNE